MKKVIIGILTGIAICFIGAIVYVKFFMFVPDKGGMINENATQNEQTNTTNMEKEVEFGGYKASEWETMIEKFYNTHLDYTPQTIKCFYDEENNFIAELDYGKEFADNFGSEQKEVYVIDPDTLYAIGEGEVMIDFINCKYVDSKVKFSDNQILAIGYVVHINTDEFIVENFHNSKQYFSLETFEYESYESKEEGTVNKFVIIPKSEDVKISLYECSVDSNGEMQIGRNLIKDRTEAFMIWTDYFAEATMPEFCIKFEYNGFEDTFPIVFNGMDGKLDLAGHEMEVKDISVYSVE